MANIQSANYTVPAKVGSNEGRVTVASFSEFVYCVSASAQLKLRDDQGNEYPLLTGVKVKIDTPAKQLELINESLSDVTAEIIFGFGQWEINSFNGVVTITPGAGVSGLAAITLTGGATDTVPANSSRKKMTLRAYKANAGSIWIGATSADNGTYLDPGDAIDVDVTSAVSIFGTAGDKLSVMEYL